MMTFSFFVSRLNNYFEYPKKFFKLSNIKLNIDSSINRF